MYWETYWRIFPHPRNPKYYLVIVFRVPCPHPSKLVNIINYHFYHLLSDNESRIGFLSPWMTEIYNICLPFLYGLTHVSKVGSVFTTLAVSLERYFAVCRPLWIRIRRCHPALYIVIVTLFAFAFNIPKFMEFEVSHFRALFQYTVSWLSIRIV